MADKEGSARERSQRPVSKKTAQRRKDPDRVRDRGPDTGGGKLRPFDRRA